MSEALKTDPYRSPAAVAPSQELYRSVSKAAIASFVFAILGLLGFWAPLFVVLSFLAICFGAVGYFNIRRMPDELVGQSIAVVGLLVGTVVFLGSVGLHSYVYATEVPEGHERLTFYELKPKTSKKLFTERAEELDGKKIFLKGYVRPGDKKDNLSQFVLTGDFGDCCFGGNPKINEIIGVKILSEQTVDYSLRLRSVIGTFRLNRTPKPTSEKDVPQIVYEIEASEIR
jgi:hypothetical protein